MVWMLLVLFYGLAKGAREISKKKALAKNSVIEVLFFYTFVSFVMVLPEGRNGFGLDWTLYVLIAIKSLVIFVAWMFSFTAIKKLPISVMGILDMSRVLFATFLGVFFLGETMGQFQIWGLLFVITGLFMLPLPNAIAARKQAEMGHREGLKPIVIILALASCMLNAVSGAMDKYIMGMDITSGQLQFWYMFFLVAYYGIYILVKKTRIDVKSLLKNYWILLLSLLFVLADRALFIANADPSSKVTIMTLIKQSSCLVTIFGGKFIFEEKNILYKVLCAGVITLGIVIAVL